ncbi:MAG: mismatch-specific DNA-glycosylase [Alphaproteobacteria bacterium]
MSATRDILPDVLEPGLRLVFCGSAAGTASARRRAYYAGPGNRFWPTLFDVGLTPRLLAPCEFRTVLRYGMGLTDLTKDQFGEDRTIRRRADDAMALERKVERYQPGILAFVGKAAAKAALGLARVGYGPLERRMATTQLFVLPSPSGAARGSWDPGWWQALARHARVGP